MKIDQVESTTTTRKQQGKVCQVCGDGSASFQGFIMTCCRCFSTQEHVYCMKVLKLEIPEDWICESCVSGENDKEAVSKSTLQFHKQKPKGKVKFLTQDQVIRLSSGTSESPSPANPRYNNTHSTNNIHTKMSPPSRPTHHPPDLQIEDLPSSKRFLSLYGAYVPSVDGNWRGGINIVDISRSDIFMGILAQPPSQVRRRVFQLSQNLPPILQVKMVPRAKCLVDHCLDGYVDFTHIGLYFFPSDTAQRSRYDKLFERMEMEESVIIGYVDEVELIIFTSKQLKVDLELNDFLWGLFRKPSKGKGVCEETANEDVDMEIDMAGGQDVGRVDVVVHRQQHQIKMKPKQCVEADVLESLKSLQELSRGFVAADYPPGFPGKRLKTEPL